MPFVGQPYHKNNSSSSSSSSSSSFTCLKLTIETLKKVMKYVQS